MGDLFKSEQELLDIVGDLSKVTIGMGARMFQQARWTIVRPGFTERRSNFLKSGEHSDVSFRFDTEDDQVTLKAHSQLLALSSDVFEAMFFGGFARESDIHVRDITPKAFNMMLKYVYGDRVVIESVADAMDVYKAADKYAIMDLIDDSFKYLNQNVMLSNALEMYHFADMYFVTGLKKTVLKFFSANTEVLLRDRSLLTAPIESLEALFGMEELNIHNEICLVMATSRYMVARDLAIDDPQVIRLLKRIRYHQIRLIDIDTWMLDKNTPIHEDLFDAMKRYIISAPFGENPNKRTYSLKEPKPRRFVFEFIRDCYLVGLMRNFGNAESRVLLTPMCMDTRLVGIKIASQVLRDVKPKLEGLTYTEDFTVSISDTEDCTLAKRDYKGEVRFGTHIWVDFERPVKLCLNSQYVISVYLRATGRYPVVVGAFTAEGNFRLKYKVTALQKRHERDIHTLILGFRFNYQCVNEAYRHSGMRKPASLIFS